LDTLSCYEIPTVLVVLGEAGKAYAPGRPRNPFKLGVGHSMRASELLLRCGLGTDLYCWLLNAHSL